MAIAWVRNQNSGLLVSTDQISQIGSVINPDNTWSYTLYTPGQPQPFYTSGSTYPNALVATLTAYQLLIIELT